MGRGPRSRASRAERRMQKERAASAIKHGLPVTVPSSVRGRNLDTPRSSAISSAASLSALTASQQRLPLPVKLVGLGLALLGSIYGLTLFRDHKPSAEAERPRATLASEASILSPAVPALALAASITSASPEPSASVLASASARPPMFPHLAASLKAAGLSAQPATSAAAVK